MTTVMKSDQALQPLSGGTAEVDSARVELVSRTNLVVLVCRACCCGNSVKHEGVDHDAQELQLRQACEQQGAVFRIVDCLDQCSESNVIVLRWWNRNRRCEIWLGQVLLPQATEAVAGLIKTLDRNSPNPVPDTLTRHVFQVVGIENPHRFEVTPTPRVSG